MTKTVSSEGLELRLRLGRNLAVYRKALNWTQDKLAEMVGVEMETISRFEWGVTMSSLLTLAELARHLNVSVASLLAESEPGEEAAEKQLLGCLARLPEDKRRFVVNHLQELCRWLES